ncbi:WD40 repeat domain-containing protein [Streptomyces sp. NPDC093568]|uniref:WD40 repeat domain-containing protein n=1 Tax=Streptomyces sp. NPDC093568 TaxID=3366041 RepID=UPI0037F9DBE0
MATCEATPTTVVDERCPVCLGTLTDEPECAHCHWPLDGPLQLGRLTPDVRDAFDERLTAARRRLDLRAAARAAGYPERGESERLAWLERLVRGGPPSAGERDDALRELTQNCTLRGGEAGQLPDGVVAEITPQGLRAVVVRNGVEDLGATEWPWAELVPGLPPGEDAALFRLAGGIGDWDKGPAELREPTDLGVAATASVLVSRLGGWTVPERLLDRLRRRLPHARTVYLPLREPQPGPLHHKAGFTAVGCGSVPEADEVRLAGGSADGCVTVWRLWHPEPLATRALHDRRVTCVDFTEDGLSVVTGGQDGAVRLWSFGGSGRVRVLTWHNGWVNAVRQRGGVVFSVGDDARLRRSVIGAAGTESVPLAQVGWASGTVLDATPDGRTVFVGGSDGVTLWDGTSGERIARLPPVPAVTSLALAPAGRLLAVGCEDSAVRVFDVYDDRRQVCEVGGHDGQVRRIALDAGGALATADNASTIRFSARGGEPAVELGTHPAPVHSLAFDSDGHLLSAGGDGVVRTWPLPTPTHATSSERRGRE